MGEAGNFAMAFDGVKSPARLTLSARRVSGLLRHIYADISGLSQTGSPQAVSEGRAGPFRIARGALLAAAIMMALPAIMLVLSLLLRPRLHRGTNIVLGVLYTLVMLVAMLPGGWLLYLLLGGVEIMLTLTLIWFGGNGPVQPFHEIPNWKHA